MNLSLSKNDLFCYTKAQCNYLFPDGNELEGEDVLLAFSRALERLEYCFSFITVRGFNIEGNPYFNHLHSDQYAMFLYFYANSLWEISQNSQLGDKLFYLNKSLHGCFISYRYRLPDIFLLSHPLGTVIGNPICGDYLFVAQGVTIEGSGRREGKQTTLGKGCFLGSGAKILGECHIGDRVSVGAGAMVYDQTIDNDKVVTIEKGLSTVRSRKSDICASGRVFRMVSE